MFSCCCASPDCKVNGCMQARRLRTGATITATPGALSRVPHIGQVKAIEYHPDGSVKRVEYH